MHIKHCVIVISQISRVVKTIEIMENTFKSLRLCDISVFAEWQETIEIVGNACKTMRFCDTSTFTGTNFGIGQTSQRHLETFPKMFEMCLPKGFGKRCSRNC